MELNELVVDKNQEMHWRETARWIKFEEDVEEDTARWGKPHVASLSFRSLLELRKTIAHGKSEIALCFWPGFVYCPGTSFAGQLLLPFGCSLKTCQHVSVQAPCWMWGDRPSHSLFARILQQPKDV